jgi:hypothetical protein
MADLCAIASAILFTIVIIALNYKRD